MSRRSAHRLFALVLLLTTGSFGCWEQWSEDWWPQMKWQKAIQAYERVQFHDQVAPFMPPEGAVAVDAEAPLLPQYDPGVDALVIVKSEKDMAAIVKGNELGKVATDPSRLLVAVIADNKALKTVESLADAAWGNERIQVGRHAAYLWCADGILESKAAGALLKGLKGLGTTRNWATLNKIHALMGERV